MECQTSYELGPTLKQTIYEHGKAVYGVSKRRVAFALIILVAVLWWTGNRVRDHFSYLAALEEHRTHHFQDWITTQRGKAYQTDRHMAEILTSADKDVLNQALARAGDQAYSAREALWRNAPHMELSRVLSRWDLHRNYENIASYLHFLAQQDREDLLTAVELQNINLIREYAAVMVRGFNDLWGRVRYTVEDSEGRSTIRYFRWHQIRDDLRIPRIADDMAYELGLLDMVGRSDSAYQNHLAQIRYSPEDREEGLAHSGQEKLDKEARLQRAEEFLATFFVGEVTDEFAIRQDERSQFARSVEVEGPTVVSGSGQDRAVGEYTFFSLMDSETHWRYEVGVTEVGGQIMRLELRERPSDIGTKEELMELAQRILDEWATFTGITLTLIEDHQDQDRHTHQVWAMTEDGITYVDHSVYLVVRHDARYTTSLELDASRYFHRYGSQVEDLRPQITPEEAMASLSPNLEATEEPVLQGGGSTLVYRIPVAGVDGVRTIVINAVSGDFMHMEYVFPRN